LPKLPVVRLGRPEDPAASGFNGAQDDGGPPILIKVGPDAAEKLTVDREVLKRPDPVLGEAPKKGEAKKKRPLTKAEATAAKTEYESALATLRDQHKPSEARAMFVAFRTKHPDSELDANAAYWLAECSFAEGQHGRAADEFKKLAEDYPASVKVPDALLRAGQSYVELKDFTKASDLLRRVKTTYPGSDVASEADKTLRSINEARGDGR
jgi:tol-pal system protein YbgF